MSGRNWLLRRYPTPENKQISVPEKSVHNSVHIAAKGRLSMEIEKRLGRYTDTGLLILRIGLGIMFLYHGAPKLFGGPEMWAKIGTAAGNFGLSFAPAFWGFMAGIAEFGGGLFLLLGLFFTPACVLLVIDLVVASSTHFHAGQGLAGASHAIEDAIVFLSLVFIGPGKFSLGALLASRKAVKPERRPDPA